MLIINTKSEFEVITFLSVASLQLLFNYFVHNIESV